MKKLTSAEIAVTVKLQFLSEEFLRTKNEFTEMVMEGTTDDGQVVGKEYLETYWEQFMERMDDQMDALGKLTFKSLQK